MATRAQSNRKNIMREFTIHEMSAVDRPAQAHARAVLMKRAEISKNGHGEMSCPSPLVITQEVQALDFAEVLAEDKAREASERVKDCVWSKWSALQRSFGTIAADENVSAADKVSRMKLSLQQFLDALAEESEAIAESITKSLTAVPALAGLLPENGATKGDQPMTDAEKKQFAELQKTVEALTSKLEAATTAEPAKKAAELQEQLEKATADLAELSKKLEAAEADKTSALAKAGMSDAEKEYLAGLSGLEKTKFMEATPADRKKMMSKAADANPVVYKADDGQLYHKDDDPRLVAMAKRADAEAKKAAEEREARETAEHTKRADDFLKAFAGEAKDKIEVVRAISKMEDGPRAALEKMLETGSKAIAAAFSTIGHSNETLKKTASDFNKRVADIQTRDKCSRSDAMSKARAEDPAAFEAYQAAGAN